ncbi:MAG: DUF5654 family protein [Promethearchaeota archaeon]
MIKKKKENRGIEEGKQGLKKEMRLVNVVHHYTTTSVKKFRNELRKSLKTALIAAFGFLIALTWRDLIKSYVDKFSESAPLHGELISALIVTFICVLGVLIITGIFQEENENKKS